MVTSNYTNRLFGRTRGRSKKSINLKTYYELVDKYKFQKCNDKLDYILEWNYFLVLLFFYFLSFLMWKKLKSNPSTS